MTHLKTYKDPVGLTPQQREVIKRMRWDGLKIFALFAGEQYAWLFDEHNDDHINYETLDMRVYASLYKLGLLKEIERIGPAVIFGLDPLAMHTAELKGFAAGRLLEGIEADLDNELVYKRPRKYVLRHLLAKVRLALSFLPKTES